MDTPEPPTIWPPAPTLTPPEIVEKPKISLRLPDWAAYWFSRSFWWFVAIYVYEIFAQEGFNYHAPWDTVRVKFGGGFVFGGLLTAWKYRPKRKTVKK